ncbi:MlaE family lipid ABC transporter permease subunit [Neorhizobium galegae]|uniref:ABC transporter permease n=1 Tax=Neorhizobium galegae TaxID=399 RepID=UPI0006220C24|nr:MlaE family lipid ABC transporter permease subunit [Neorhizobium galegae]MCQ1572403.1 MlaE family lipid ABC transporter permease subunit [Neorhizobium galegae]MCQ1836877.1 MlaE family lipid ABC transporter permease subunit [Neorhizobium galegae]UIY31160.1 MlaE family lipid ABC transporter permease subunit [Neorhizobium galegae]CDZ72303.1 Sulfate transporter/antisigma-factor [Neorhizobium galegae bv. orientalis]
MPGDGGERYVLAGEWRGPTISPVLKEFERLENAANRGKVEIDLSGITGVDTAGAWLIRRLMTAKGGQGGEAALVGGEGPIRELIGVLPEHVPAPPADAGAKGNLFERLFVPLGKVMVSLGGDFYAAMHILGSAVRGAQMKFGRGAGVSPASVVTHIDRMGVRAVPIIVLMSFLIGAIIAQQGAFQLRYFGAEIFVVDLVGILQLREIGVLLTAIMIAGRSGSAITAEIGSMKMREEIDALTVIGLNPVGVLIFPRLVALTVALPLLTIIANFSALFGAAVVALAYSGITFDTYLSRLHEAIDHTSVASGMIKAPFMALAIGIVAAVEGMKVGGSAESLGQHVTTAVVKSIFAVIFIDAMFALFYSAIDF